MMGQLFAMTAPCETWVSFGPDSLAGGDGDDRPIEAAPALCDGMSPDHGADLGSAGRQAVVGRHVVAHIRDAGLAGDGATHLHLFSCVDDGHAQHFAHAGKLDDLRAKADTIKRRTESEMSARVFLLLLARLRGIEDERIRFAVFRRFSWEMRALGAANFLFFDGRMLFVHADRRGREGADVSQPGLFTRHFSDGSGEDRWRAPGVCLSGCKAGTILFASAPLDCGPWDPLPLGTVLALRDGELLFGEVL
jgi:glutamine amidotransferase